MPVRMGQKFSGGFSVKASAGNASISWRDVPALAAASGCHQQTIFGSALQVAGIFPSTFAVGLGRIHRRGSSADYAVVPGTWGPPSSVVDDGELFESDLQKPAGLDELIERPTADKLEQLKHSWNPDDRSLNIFIKEDEDDSGLTVRY